MVTTRRRARWLGVVSVCAVTLMSACSFVVPASLPLPGRSDPNPSTQAQVAATTIALQAQAQATVDAAAQARQRAAATPTAAPTQASAPAQQLVKVQRGPISQTAQFDGRIAAADESPLSFGTTGSVATVSVSVGQSVTAGQVLVQTDSKAIQQNIKDTQSRADSAAIQVQMTQSQDSARQQDAQTQAQNAVEAAQANLAKVQAGASDADRQTAQQGVLTAQAALDKANADLAQLQAGPSAAELGATQRQITNDQLALRQAQADKAKLVAGPDPAALRTAQQDVANAQDGLTIAQGELTTLTAGPDPFELRAAQRDLERAQAALKAAQALTVASGKTPDPGSVTQAQKDSSVSEAQFGLQAAQDAMNRLNQPPKPEVVTAAKNKLDNAKATLQAAQDKLTALQQAPDQLSIDKADAAVTAAQATLDNDQAHLTNLQQGPSPDQLQSASSAVDAAQSALNVAQSRRDDINSHPTAAELAQAHKQLADAQAAASRAQSANTAQSNGASALQQKDASQIRQQLASLQSDLEATNLRAPFDGVVTSVLVNVGDNVMPGKTVVTVAQPGDPIVTLTLPLDSSAASTPANPNGSVSTSNPGAAAGTSGNVTTPDGTNGSAASLVAQGQVATVQVDGGDGTQYEASISKIVSTVGPNGGRSAQLAVNWHNATPPIGQTALVRVTVQQKQDALLVPASAIHAVGPLKYVDVDVNGVRQTVNVRTGLVTDSNVEIVSGLSEGQSVVSGPATSVAAGPAAQTQTQVTPTTSPSPTLIQTSSMPARPTPEQMLLDERFGLSHQTWPDDPSSTAWFGPDGYHLEARDPGQFVAIAAPVKTVIGDGRVTATFHKIGGPVGGGYGIILGDQEPSARDGRGQTGSFVVAEIGDLGEVGIWRRTGDEWTELMPWTKSDAVHKGNDSNQLMLQAAGRQLTFSVNGTVVATMNDPALAPGGVGVFIGGDGNQVIADQFAVQTVQATT